VAPEISVREGHAIVHAGKEHLAGQIIIVKDVLVHVELAPGAGVRETRE
jgi:hypothetical protein